MRWCLETIRHKEDFESPTLNQPRRDLCTSFTKVVALSTETHGPLFGGNYKSALTWSNP